MEVVEPQCQHSAKLLFSLAIVSFGEELQVGGKKFSVIISLLCWKQALCLLYALASEV